MAMGYNFTSHLDAGVRPYRVSQAPFSVLFLTTEARKTPLATRKRMILKRKRRGAN